MTTDVEKKRNVEFSVGYILQAITVSAILWTGSELISLSKTVAVLTDKITYITKTIDRSENRILDLERQSR